MPADPLYSTNLTVVLSQLGKVVLDNFWNIERGGDVDQYLIEPKKVIILPSYFYWMPTEDRLGVSGNIISNLDRLVRSEGMENFPLLGVTGRATRQVMTLGGGVSLNTNFRLYLLTAAPPSQDLVEKVGMTIGHIARITVAHIYYPPFWWFIDLTEEDIIVRPEVGGIGVTGGFIGGTLRGMPHIVPFVPRYRPSS